MRPRKISGCTCNFRVDLLNEFLQAPILLGFPPDPETMPKWKKHDSDADDVAPRPDQTTRPGDFFKIRLPSEYRTLLPDLLLRESIAWNTYKPTVDQHDIFTQSSAS